MLLRRLTAQAGRPRMRAPECPPFIPPNITVVTIGPIA
ncbi:hypothetical protein Pd630_LPD10111 (plasmid) [Rhodococcus opacus PD630]|nr:hypothetical protein Pd630_LPD10111 [Rhodococcus opacus PD630]